MCTVHLENEWPKMSTSRGKQSYCQWQKTITNNGCIRENYKNKGWGENAGVIQINTELKQSKAKPIPARTECAFKLLLKRDYWTR